MLANTGTVSFILYGIFIIITLAGMVVAFRLIKKSPVGDVKIEKMIELFKYSVVSVAIATVTLIVSDLFKERQQDVEELVYFDRYVQDVKNVDGIKQRMQLAKYLAIVAPSGQMQEAWQRYSDSTRAEYREYLKEMAEKEKLDTAKKLSITQQVRKVELAAAIEQKESPLVSYQKITTGNVTAARDWESKGFDYLLKKDVANAINSFNNSESSYNAYHQVFEIARYLSENKIQLASNSSPFWKQAYQKISTSFSYGMPEQIKSKMKELAE